MEGPPWPTSLASRLVDPERTLMKNCNSADSFSLSSIPFSLSGTLTLLLLRSRVAIVNGCQRYLKAPGTVNLTCCPGCQWKCGGWGIVSRSISSDIASHFASPRYCLELNRLGDSEKKTIRIARINRSSPHTTKHGQIYF